MTPPQNPKSQRNKKIFFVVFFLFILAVIGVTYDMARRTTAPWNKKKQIIRAWDGDTDTTKVDTVAHQK